ncbi:MAG: hypothetical protein V3T21_04270 [Candidatus Margulisiibacteriota bacterium]
MVSPSSGILKLKALLAPNLQPPAIETIIKALEKKKIFISTTALHPLCLSKTEKLARKLHQKLRATAKLNEKEVNQVIKELEFGDAFFAVDIGGGEIEIHLKNKRVILAGQEDPRLRFEVQGWLEGPFSQAEEHFRGKGYTLSKREDGKVIVTLAPQERSIKKSGAPFAVKLSPVEILKKKRVIVSEAALKHPGLKELSAGLLKITKPTEEKINQELEKLGLHKTFFAVEVWGQIRIHLVDKRLNVWPEFPHLRWRLQNLLKLRDNAPNQDVKEEHFKSFKKLVDENVYRISGHVKGENGFEMIFISNAIPKIEFPYYLLEGTNRIIRGIFLKREKLSIAKSWSGEMMNYLNPASMNNLSDPEFSGDNETAYEKFIWGIPGGSMKMFHNALKPEPSAKNPIPIESYRMFIDEKDVYDIDISQTPFIICEEDENIIEKYLNFKL